MSFYKSFTMIYQYVYMFTKWIHLEPCLFFLSPFEFSDLTFTCAFQRFIVESTGAAA